MHQAQQRAGRLTQGADLFNTKHTRVAHETCTRFVLNRRCCKHQLQRRQLVCKSGPSNIEVKVKVAPTKQSAAAVSSTTAPNARTSGGLPNRQSQGAESAKQQQHSVMRSSTGTASPEPATVPEQRLPAKERMEQLRRAQAQSWSALQQRSSQFSMGKAKTIDIRMYEQAVALRNRMTERMTETAQYVSVLEQRIDELVEALQLAQDMMQKTSLEFGATARLAEAATAAVQFSVDPKEGLTKLTKLHKRLQLLEQGMQEQRDVFDEHVPRPVPVAWVGVASEVVMMGDFDNWTRGIDLSADDVTNDNVMATFKAAPLLKPGSYRIKFRVDGEWRLAADWPAQNSPEGEANILVVKS